MSSTLHRVACNHFVGALCGSSRFCFSISSLRTAARYTMKRFMYDNELQRYTADRNIDTSKQTILQQPAVRLSSRSPAAALLERPQSVPCDRNSTTGVLRARPFTPSFLNATVSSERRGRFSTSEMRDDYSRDYIGQPPPIVFTKVAPVGVRFIRPVALRATTAPSPLQAFGSSDDALRLPAVTAAEAAKGAYAIKEALRIERELRSQQNARPQRLGQRLEVRSPFEAARPQLRVHERWLADAAMRSKQRLRSPTSTTTVYVL